LIVGQKLKRKGMPAHQRVAPKFVTGRQIHGWEQLLYGSLDR
jgi:hypothetical protein